MRSTIFAFISLLALATVGKAQVTSIPGTGCGAPITTAVQGSPNLGTQIVIRNAFSCTTAGVVGVGFNQIAFQIPNCQGRNCILGVDPLVTVISIPTAQIAITIPADPNLIGVCLFAQAACLQQGCIDLVEVAVRICVMP